MNKQPVSYLQYDKRWKDKPYRVPGEDATVGGSGCGPSCAAMVISTLTEKTYTPLDACNWSVAHGYKALKQGTYYGYFVPQLKAFGVNCRRLNTASVYHKPDSSVHDEMISWLRKGYYVIALMKKELDQYPETCFFLATDDNKEEALLRKTFPGRIISNELRVQERNSVEGMQDALVDLWCLAASSKIIGSFWSSFTDTAADMRGIEKVIDGDEKTKEGE